jgi:hypothetical protein
MCVFGVNPYSQFEEQFKPHAQKLQWHELPFQEFITLKLIGKCFFPIAVWQLIPSF